MLCHSPLPSKIHHPPSAINIQHSHPKSTTHHPTSPSTITIVHPSSTIAEITIMNDIFPPEWYIFWDYIHLLLFFLRDGAIQSLVIFRVHNSVEFPGGWEDEEEDELWEGSGESVSVGAAVGAVGQRLLEQPGSHYLQPFCWRRTKLNPLLTGQMVHHCGLNDQGVAWKISEEEDYRVSQKSC